jgi:hypothetical protein
MRKIKELFVGVMVMVSFFGVMCWAGNLETTYNMDAEIIQEGVLLDARGDIWDFEDDNFKVGDKVKVTFFNNYTINKISDDEIVKIKLNKR